MNERKIMQLLIVSAERRNEPLIYGVHRPLAAGAEHNGNAAFHFRKM